MPDSFFGASGQPQMVGKPGRGFGIGEHTARDGSPARITYLFSVAHPNERTKARLLGAQAAKQIRAHAIPATTRD